MKNQVSNLLLALTLFAGATMPLFAQGTAFTYQGRLNTSGLPANGSYDFTFTLFETNVTGTSLAGPVTNAATSVTNGLFVATIDFGAVFTGASNWLDIAVRTNGSGAFTTLVPRQQLTPAPYAITAQNLSGTLAATQVSGVISSGQLPPNVITNMETGVTLGGSFSGNGGGLTNLNAAGLTGTLSSASLAPGAAAANLAAENQTAVPSGGVILSASGGLQEQNLLNAGYIRFGSVNLVQEGWTTNLVQGPADTGELVAARVGHSAVWTGTEMIVWGGYDESRTYNNGAAYNPTANTWRIINSNSGLSPRFNHAAGWTGSKMIIWGGDTGNPDAESFEYTNDGAMYNPISDSWTPMAANNTLVAREGATAIWTGANMLIWGGYTVVGSDNAFGEFQESVTDVPNGGSYNPAVNTWTPISNAGAPIYSTFHTAVWTGTNMIVYGGNGGTFSGGRYNPASNTWSSISSSGSPGPRYSHSAVWTGTNMIVWGGFGSTQDTNTGASYNPANNTWTSVATSGAPSPRESHSAIWTGSQMIIWGGDVQLDADTNGASYNPANNSWTALPNSGAPAGRFSHTAIWTGSEMLIWGGAEFAGENLDSSTVLQGVEPGGIYLPSFNLWESLSDAPGTGEPGARQNATAVWTGSEMLVWGGENSGFSLHTGGRFNLAGNFWTPINITNAPSPRQGHTAIWTGNSMVIWGGQNNGSTASTGGRYYPATDSWLPTSSINVPVARANHVAVWDGTEMLVWGGYETSLLLPAAGGRYNPVADTWVLMNTTNQPAPASQSAAVWTGNGMLVWGGNSGNVLGSNYTANGGIYYPATDSWSPVSTANAPSVRAGHMAFWTGSQCIIFGGFNGFTNLNSGGLYNVVSNTWTSMSISNNSAPAVSGSSAVWTGTRMLVVGGYNSEFIYNAALELYDPVQNAWSLTTVALPGHLGLAGFLNASVVWTGFGMILWGGFLPIELPEDPYLNTPYLYTPPQTMDLLLRP